MEHNLEHRMTSLDVMRGIALLGILLMNIQSFSAPFLAYANPTAFGDFSGVNFWVWSLGHVFFEQKFMAIFSILFGAGLAIFYARATAKNLNVKALNQRRMLFLLIFGAVHAYLIWYGDILFSYALCGLIAINFVEKTTKKIVFTAVFFLLVPVLLTWLLSFAIVAQSSEGAAEMMAYWAPSAEQLQIEIESFKGSWLDARAYSVSNAFMLQSFGFLFYTLWRATGLMLLGIVMVRTGFITAQLAPSSYRIVGATCLVVGLSLSAIGVQQHLAHAFEMNYSSGLGTLFNYFGSLFTAIGYIALVMLLVQSRRLVRLQALLANVGRMAFTNYIMQSVICTFIFYGFGLGYFAELDRVQCLAIVAIIWAMQLYWSSAWLSRFKQGPLEKLWRSVTYNR